MKILVQIVNLSVKLRYENIEFHKIVDKKAFEKEDHIIK